VIVIKEINFVASRS